MIGGYTWSVTVDEPYKVIRLVIYLQISAERTIALPGGASARVSMQSGMPWAGKTSWNFDAPEGWTWEVFVPRPEYAEGVNVSLQSSNHRPSRD